MREDSFEQKRRQLEQELEESGLKKIYSEVIWDIIPEINEISQRSVHGIRKTDHG